MSRTQVTLTCCVGLVMLAAGIAAIADPPAGKKVGDWPMWGGSPDRNMVSDETGFPAKWDVEEKTNILWVAPLGSQAYGNPSVAGGKVFVGTNNNGEHRKGITGDKGVVLCFDAKTGKMLWQATHDKLPTGRVNDWPEQGICSSPLIDGDRVYYVSNRCELVCADTEGFLDGENDGPYKQEKYKEKEDADFVWILDMIEELGAFPHNLATSSPVIGDDMIFVVTGNGVDEAHLHIPSPRAPSFIAVDKKTGEVVWESSAPGDKILHGQWSSPAYGVVNGVKQVVFPGGDGWVRGFEPKTGKELWRFDMNPKDAVWKLGGRGTRNNIIATPVIFDSKVFLAVGQDPEHGEGVGHLYGIDASKRGDITETGRLWHLGGEDFGRSMSTVAIYDGLLYACDLGGFLKCVDAKTGKVLWQYDCESAVWGSPYVVDEKLYVGNEDGEVIVLKHGPKLEELAINQMNNSVYTTPVASNGILYVANRRNIFAIRQSPETGAAADAAQKESSGK